MNIKLIRNEEDYDKALDRVDILMELNPDNYTKESDELEILALLIEKYEEKEWIISQPDPIEAIKFRMEEEGLEQKDLITMFGTKSKVSEILNKKRKLTIEMIRNLHKHLHIPIESLFLDYKITQTPHP